MPLINTDQMLERRGAAPFVAAKDDVGTRRRRVGKGSATAHSDILAGVRNEDGWRRRPAPAPGGLPCPILVSRWKDDSAQPRQHASFADPKCAIVAIALRPTDAEVTVDGRPVHDGRVQAGTVLITPVGSSTRISFRRPCDMLHLFVPSDRLEGIAADAGNTRSATAFDEVRVLAPDSTIEGLAWLLFKGGAFHAVWADVYVDGIAIAILAKVLHAQSEGCESPANSGLVTWRLKRVKDFIEADIAAPLSLRALASCAGLSRMHFAAQFRAATGMKPHEYVVHRRIQRAQEILRTSTMPLVEVALTVGFQTQAHFTTVFRRALSETPGRWRRVQQMASGRDRRENDAMESCRAG